MGVRSLPRASTNDHCWELNPRPFTYITESDTVTNWATYILYSVSAICILLYIDQSISPSVYHHIHTTHPWLFLWAEGHPTFLTMNVPGTGIGMFALDVLADVGECVAVEITDTTFVVSLALVAGKNWILMWFIAGIAMKSRQDWLAEQQNIQVKI